MADVDRRDRDKDRERERERRRSRSPRERRRSSSRGRRDKDRDRDRRRRSRSRDERRRSRSRSRSRSPGYDPEQQRRRPTWFDIAPVGGAPPPISQLPGAVMVVTDAPGASAATGFGGAAAQQATRHARRIYVGGLPPSAKEEGVSTFFSNALAAVGGTTAGPGQCVVNVYINYEKKFAFVEFRTVEEASNSMALDGIMFEGVTVRIRRPADYRAAEAASLGPSLPNPNLNLAAIGLDRAARQQEAIAAMGQQPPPMDLGAAMGMGQVPFQQPSERVFCGGLPYYLTEEQCRELLGAFGAIRSFDLIKDKETGQSKGYGFCVFEDPNVVDIACAGLHGMRMGDRALTVRRADGGQRQAEAQQATTLAPPRVVKLAEAVTMEELTNDEEYTDILEDMKEECGRFGQVLQILIPRPGPPGAPPPPGLGKVLIEFADGNGAIGARNALHGRKFGGRTVTASLMLEQDYKEQRWD